MIFCKLHIIMNAVQLPFQFDAQRIEQELQTISASFNSILSERIKGNKLKGIHLIIPNLEGEKDINGHSYHSSPELDKCPYLQSILETFQCDKFIYRIHNLTTKGKIELHRDSQRGLSNRIVRIHIPVTTNKAVHFHVNGERIYMKNGECWFADITQPHEVENRSDTDRLQLMIDCDLNDWWEHILEKHGIQLKKNSGWGNYTLEELQLMKENFLIMGTDLAQRFLIKINLEIEEKTKK